MSFARVVLHASLLGAALGVGCSDEAATPTAGAGGTGGGQDGSSGGGGTAGASSGGGGSGGAAGAAGAPTGGGSGTAGAPTGGAAGAAGAAGTGTDAGASRDARLWPFASDSPWNVALGSDAQYADENDPCTQDLRDPSSYPWINAGEWSHPVYLTLDSDPIVEIHSKGHVTDVHSPIGAQPAKPDTAGTDHHLHLIDPSGRWIDEMWRAFARPGGGWDADYHVKNDLYGPGVGEGGVRAYGGSAIGGLIRAHEIAQLHIPHVLAFAQERKNQRPGFVWPATAEDSGSQGTYLGDVPMGQLVALPPGVDLDAFVPPLTPLGKALGRALQDFGAYDVDSSGGFAIYAEASTEPDVADARDDILRLRPLLVCVLNNSPSSVGGGGATRRAPPAPELGAPP